MANCLRLIEATMLCLVFLAIGGAVESYDDAPPGFEPDFIYQVESYPDLGPFASIKREDPAKDLMLYKLLKNMQANEMLYTVPFYKPRYSFEDKNMSDTDLIEEPVKRLTHALTTVANKHTNTKPAVVQRKWKIKKGKTVGSQMICYFKLCAFRAP